MRAAAPVKLDPGVWDEAVGMTVSGGVSASLIGIAG